MRDLTRQGQALCLSLHYFQGELISSIRLYTIGNSYIEYISQSQEHIFHNPKAGKHSRKYIDILLTVNTKNYFASLSSFKEKHKHLQETTDFIKLKEYAVINLNNMFPASQEVCHPFDISKIGSSTYKDLLQAEYRVIRMRQKEILRNAKAVYDIKTRTGTESKLAKRCNDFLVLEKLCDEYEK